MVYLFLADGFEEIEALTPLDYLIRAGVLIKTVFIGESEIVTSSKGVKIFADISIDDVKLNECEMIILPGGLNGMLNLKNNEKVQQIIKYCIDNNIYIASICASPTILGEKGYLKGKNAICYKGMEDKLIGANIVDEDVVVDKNIITSKGAGTSNQFAFKLIEILCSKEKEQEIKDSVLWQ